jgi:hypothetical protein
MMPVLGFFLTVLIEFFILWLFFRKDFGFLKIFYLCFLINLFSWPLANLIYGVYDSWLVIELGVFVAESALVLVLFKCKLWKAVLAALVANFITALIGFAF